MSSFRGAHFYAPLGKLNQSVLIRGLVVFFLFFCNEMLRGGKMSKNLPDFYLDKALFISEESCGGEVVYQYILVPQKEGAFNRRGNVGKDAYYKAFCLRNGRLDTDFGIKEIRRHFDLHNYVEDATWSKFIPIGYGQLLLDEAVAKTKAVKYLKVKKLNELLDEALDAPAV